MYVIYIYATTLILYCNVGCYPGNTGDSQLSTFEVMNHADPESKSDPSLGSEEMQNGETEMMNDHQDLSQHGIYCF